MKTIGLTNKPSNLELEKLYRGMRLDLEEIRDILENGLICHTSI